MKSLNAKRIAAIVTGAALMGVGLAFASPVTFQNVQVIGNSGQPLVQVVVGSKAAITDGVAAANIAAAIGNLAFTTQQVTATVDQASLSNLKVVGSGGSSGAITNAQVYLNQTGTSVAAGSYAFSALIGSVLNSAIVLNVPQYTKNLQANTYAFLESNSLTISPVASPYTAVGSVPITQSPPTGSYNGGGVSFTSFTSGSYDNIMQITPSQLAALTTNYGSYGESATLWITGFPVYDQATGVNKMMLLDAGGAYQVTFSKPIQFNANATSSGNFMKSLNAPIQLLGQNWTVIGGYGPTTQVISTNTVAGGKVQLAAAVSNLTTVYVGHNLTAAGSPFKVQLQDLGVNQSGFAPAEIQIYYNGAPTNVSAIKAGAQQLFNVSGHLLTVKVQQTFAGQYGYQKWAKMQMFSSVFNVTDATVFNQTTNPGWFTRLLWTNTTNSVTPGNAVGLQSIILYNTSQTNLAAGQSFTFIQSPAAWKVTFIGQTSVGTDAITAAATSTGSLQYQNLGTGVTGAPAPKNVTEPAQELVVTSQIPNAFTYAGQTSQSVTFDLTPYQLDTYAANAAGTNTVGWNANSVVVQFTAQGNWITTTIPLTVTVSGYASQGSSAATTESVQVTNEITNTVLPTPLYNITQISMSRAIPGSMNVIVTSATNAATSGNTMLGKLSTTSGGADIVYPSTSKVYQNALSSSIGSVIYNQQNGQPTSIFGLNVETAPTTYGVGQFASFALNEIAVPSNTNAQDQITFGIDNSSQGVTVDSGTVFQLNYSLATGTGNSGTKNNFTYTSSGGTALNANPGFVTERGSTVTITPSQITVQYAKNVGTLSFAVGSASAATPTTTQHQYGPYTQGQQVTIPGVTNITVSKIMGNATVSGGTLSISGESSLTATPSVSVATVPVLLQNLSSTSPLVVLDTQANPASSLILVGSGYVNQISAQVQSGANVTITSSASPTIVQAYGNKILVAGYTAAQTTQAANQFIQQLYAAAIAAGA